PLELALRLTVWVYRRQRRVLRDRRRAWMTIHGARRRKHDAPYARRGNALEEHPPGRHVVGAVLLRLGHRLSHQGIGSEMHQCIARVTSEQRVEDPPVSNSTL